MTSSRLPLLLALLASSAFMLPHAAHAFVLNYQIIPTAIDQCPANWNALIVVANSIISFLLTITLTFIAPLSFAYAGFLYLTSGANPGQRSQANTMMLNLVIGIVVALASWLIVDAVMAVLYNPGASSGSTVLGTWSSLITGNSGDLCLNVAGALNQSAGATNAASCPSGLTCQSGVCYPAPQQCGGTTCQGGQVCGTDRQTCVYPQGVTCGPLTCQPNYTCKTPTAASSAVAATDQGPVIQIQGQSGNGCSAGSQPSGGECYSCPSGDTLSGSLCYPPASSAASDGYSCVAPQQCSLGAPGITGSGSGGSYLSYGSGPCNAATDADGVSGSGYSLTASQASTLACIAKYEDSCNAAPSPPNPCWNKDCGTGSGKASTAAGAFQVLLSSNSSCYDNSVCETAAGVSGPLNCRSAFTSNGYLKTDPASQALITECLNAANSLNCSVSAAACLLQNNGGSFSPWVADKSSSGQAQCIASGGG
jgi:hypothetical protein